MTTERVPGVPGALVALVHEVVDHAGLFPPAALPMPEAVRHFAAYRTGPHGWMLGRFVVQAARLDDFMAAAARHLHDWRAAGPWRLSVLVGPDTERDLARVAQLNEEGNGVVVDSLEARVVSTDGVERLAAVLPRGVHAYVELPLKGDLDSLARAVAAARLRAKARTGGVTRELVPSPEAVAAFLRACARNDVPFKLTAGLHHAVRATYPLTYAADSERATMFGFLNALVAAVLARRGEPATVVTEALEEPRRDAFGLEDDALRWRDHLLPVTTIREARERFVISFGSCSFHEPVAELGLGDALPRAIGLHGAAPRELEARG